MNVLFTKEIIQQQVIANLNETISPVFLDVLKFKIKILKKFPLKNQSLIFTSANGVEAFFKNNFLPKDNFTVLPFNKIYCVGAKTKLKLREFGFGVFKTVKNAQELCEFIIEKSSREDFLHFCGNLTLDILDEKLPLQNIKYEKIECYETELLYPKTSENFDALVFFSPSGVRSFAKHNSLENSTLFSIGETTSAEIKKLTKKDIITSKEQTLKSLLKLINNKFKANTA
ncbi:uroporphyrinogen-III synthase [Halpernia frigidisoli]|uniref:Uroporphyrinogen-III synthase n=1 Tax=Halpernia frigidisoli TaxID=1125876 RepID=A0A1I3GXI0_9FLAO|nr:uroporphyrinogen-III synthase [Halpernia frigidisoli]SFI28139.1 uroporphyrinogen-III synthase [Halpernia frigidisoli]